jgi:hypothetical protein|tara:strand:+ start:11372 stop:11992 length:621 start_codon:yes stop_codon:yes gene_type:complete
MAKSTHLCSVKFKTMRKTIIKISLIALIFGSLTAYSNEVNLKKEAKFSTKIEVDNVKNRQLLFIKNTSGKIIHKEIINLERATPYEFDFSGLENGYYTLEINKDFQIEIKPFTIISGEVIFHKKGEKTIFKPVIRAEKNKIFISKLNFIETSIHISIYYENEIIFTDNVKGDSIIEKIYSLQKEKKGSYKVITIVNDRKYTKEFSL